MQMYLPGGSDFDVGEVDTAVRISGLSKRSKNPEHGAQCGAR